MKTRDQTQDFKLKDKEISSALAVSRSATVYKYVAFERTDNKYIKL